MKFEINIDPDEFIQALVLATNDLQSIAARKTMRDIRKQVIKALVAEDEPKTDVEPKADSVFESTTLSGRVAPLIDILNYCKQYVENDASDRVILNRMIGELESRKVLTSAVTFAVSPSWLLEKLVDTRDSSMISNELSHLRRASELSKFIDQCKSEEERVLLNTNKENTK